MFITLNNGEKREFEQGITVGEIAKSISETLFRNAACGKIDGQLVDLSYNVNLDCNLSILTLKDAEGLAVYRHTCSHVLAQAVKSIFPTCQLAIGPAIENGFYYDFDFKTPITQADLVKIEAEMKKIIKSNLPIEKFDLTKKEAIKLMKGFKESYKVAIIEDIPSGTPISFYKQGAYVDMCKGPHLSCTGKIKAFKLTSLTGAYWHGDEKNKMLTRIYGTAFEKKSDLDAYLLALEEAKKRDHNKLGRELGLFMTEETVGQGLPLLMPKGAKIMQILQRFIEDEEEKRGFLLTKTPFIAKSDLYKTSGHWDHYKDKMFVLGDEQSDEEVLALRPMTCPFQYYIYKSSLKSYRDLPCRYAETAPLFRKEASGEMHGLIRIRQFTLADGHIICTPDQVESEFKKSLDLCVFCLKSLGLEKDVTFRFSKRGDNKEKYIDNDKAWEDTQNLMRGILDRFGITYVEANDEAAFYGPKLDIQAKNVFGKEDTIMTLQLDFSAGDSFGLYYIDQNGEKKVPFVIHRSSIGCYERTLALLIEKYAGAFPLWFSPVQVKLLCVTDRSVEYAKNISERLMSFRIRVECDFRSEKIGKKIRDAQLEKVPYMLILGDKECELGNIVSVRERNGTSYEMKTEDFILKVIQKDHDKSIN